MSHLTDSKTEKVAKLITEFHQGTIRDLLVVGCGEGIEAAIVAEELQADVTGIDLRGEFDAIAKTSCVLMQGDAMALDFDDGTFDFVFSYHALEHIEDPLCALNEMRRVLRENGGFWIGTPNRSRLVGYIGGKNTSFSEKLKWNLVDWKARIHGRFENRFGAHAGFTSYELREILSSVFSVVQDRSLAYYTCLYPNQASAIRMVASVGLSGRIFPSIYFSGSK